MPTWAKVVMALLVVAVIYLGVRDYLQAKWMHEKLWSVWIQTNNFKIEPPGGPGDPNKPPEPPPPFGF